MRPPQPGSVVVAHPSADLYGSDRVMLETVSALVNDGWRVIVALPTPGQLVREVEKRGGSVTFTPMPVLRKAAMRPKGLGRLILDGILSLVPSIKLIRGSEAELVYVSTLTIPLWIIISRLLRRPVVCHVHESERNAPPAVRRILALPLLLANQVIVNSRFSRSVLIDSYRVLAARSEVIYNAVPGPPVVAPPRPTVAGGLRLLFVGRLAPRKGPQVAIELAAVLRDQGTIARLDLVGSVFPGYEWFEAELRQRVVDLNMTDIVTFHGFQADIWPHLADCDLVLVPSQGDEPFGNTAVEAVLAARPVIVSTSSGLEEAVQGYECAQRVTASDVAQWSEAVVRVNSDWPTFRDAALRDSLVAAERHSQLQYQTLIVDKLSAVGRRRVRSGKLQ